MSIDWPVSAAAASVDSDVMVNVSASLEECAATATGTKTTQNTRISAITGFGHIINSSKRKVRGILPRSRRSAIPAEKCGHSIRDYRSKSYTSQHFSPPNDVSQEKRESWPLRARRQEKTSRGGSSHIPRRVQGQGANLATPWAVGQGRWRW